jgi:hypothetical protein
MSPREKLPYEKARGVAGVGSPIAGLRNRDPEQER